ncbi:DWNN domain-containing protein [Massariosphaeria phaeospora]|uniref:DWNN domain-containing protein n=1 Tax=Massariosphaeria phaeospora TaxID=100035 RepID=A0A7C8IKR3_9PLEO|nr:DWNN domain-containing protein [Massariosphaeria phaeospora]
MSSSVFYRFKNSKDSERILFDGTGISVFELKREIIKASGLGDGSDFNLHLYSADQPPTEYTEDTTIISRSTTVVARRTPAARGHGGAARYVSGRAPARAIKKADPKPTITATAGGAGSEEEAKAAFELESERMWDQQKQGLAQGKRIHNNNNKKPPVPNHDPPGGYVCHRCQTKGHWIQACPTNDDPNHKPALIPKKTTGIPQSFLKKVEKPKDDEEARGVRMDAEGNYFLFQPDTKTWDKYQEKREAQAASADAGIKEVRARGLVCELNEPHMFLDPVKMSCCGKTYCRSCIGDKLADEDLVCPNCQEKDIIIDDLTSDEEMVGKLRAFKAEKAKEESERLSSTTNEAKNSMLSPTVSQQTPSVSGSDSEGSTTSKKRKEPPTDIKPPTAPKAMRRDQQTDSEKKFIEDMEVLGSMPTNLPIVPNVNMPVTMGMPINPMMAMMNPLNMNGMNPMNGGFNNNWNGYGQGHQNNMGYGNMGYNNSMGGYGYGYQNNPGLYNPAYNVGFNPQNTGHFPNQQRTVFAEQPNPQDAYERKPLNPHRSRNWRKQRDFHHI